MDKEKELISDAPSRQNATASPSSLGESRGKNKRMCIQVPFSATPLVPRELDCCIRYQEARTLSDKSCIQCGSKEIWGF